MGFTKHNFQDGDTLNAAPLNEDEDYIEYIANELEMTSDGTGEKQAWKNGVDQMLDEITEPSGENMFDMSVFDGVAGITRDANGYYTGTGLAFANAFGQSTSGVPGLTFETGARYFMSAVGYCDGDSTSAESGFKLRFVYGVNDESGIIFAMNDHTSSKKSAISTNGKSVTKITMGYARASGTVWHIKDIMLTKSGDYLDEYSTYLTSVDKTARLARPAVERVANRLGKIDNMVNYGYDIPYSGRPDYYNTHIERSGTIITLHAPLPASEGGIPINSSAMRIKLDSNIVGIFTTSAISFPNGIKLIDGHVYRLRMHPISGTASNTIHPAWLKAGDTLRIGDYRNDGDDLYTDMIYSSSGYSTDGTEVGATVAVYVVRSEIGNIIDNYKFELTVTDITYAPQNENTDALGIATNIIHVQDLQEGYYWTLAAQGKAALSPNASYDSTDKIDIGQIEQGSKIQMFVSTVGSIGIFITDENMVVLDKIRGNYEAPNLGYKNSSYIQFVTLTVPENAKYIMATQAKSQQLNIRSFDIFVNPPNNIERLSESIAPTEQHTATSNHSVGDLIMVDNLLYEVTSAIATGEQLVVGTNIKRTALSDRLPPVPTTQYTGETSTTYTLKAEYTYATGEITYRWQKDGE